MSPADFAQIHARLTLLERALGVFTSWLEDHEDIDSNGNANEEMQLLIELKEKGVLE